MDLVLENCGRLILYFHFVDEEDAVIKERSGFLVSVW